MKLATSIVIALTACGTNAAAVDGGSGASSAVAGGGSSGAATSAATSSSAATGGTASSTRGGTGSSAATTTGSTSGSSSGEGGLCVASPGYTGNAQGIGGYCTAGGGQCSAYGSGLTCAADEPGGSGADFCFTIGNCTVDSDCGSGACCVLEDVVVHVCLPVGCAADGGTTCPG